MQDLSQLTRRELEIIKNPNVINLGDAYPRITLPSWLEAIVLDIDELQTGYYPWGAGLSTKTANVFDLQKDLLISACRCLGIDEKFSKNACVTFSDSLSLFHAIVSQIRAGDSVITTNPSIDIVTGMIRSYTQAELIHVPAYQETFGVNTDAIASAIKDTTSTIIITTPENPTGAVCTEEQILYLVDIATKHDITLIFDQCFAKLNPYKINIPLLPNYATSNLKWIFTWGTGKNFGLSGDKLGFIFCSPQVEDALRKSVNLLQFELSRRMLMMFKTMLDSAVRENYFEYLSDIISNNASLVQESLRDTLIQSPSFDAGSVILLDIGILGLEDENFTDDLLVKKSVGIIPVRYFFYADTQGAEMDRSYQFARVALARNPEYLKQGLKNIVEYCMDRQNKS